MRSLSIAIVCLALAGCGDGNAPIRQSRQSKQPKELYFRGDIVSHKSDHRRGVVTGKRWVSRPEQAGGMHDCWLYEVRFPTTSLGDDKHAYAAEWVGEFELEPALGK